MNKDPLKALIVSDKQPARIKMVKDAVNPEPMELLAKSVIQVAEAASKLVNSGLTSRAIIVLLHDGIGQGKITKSQIKLVLLNLPKLKYWYLK